MTIYLAEGQRSALTDVGFWDGLFWVGVIGIVLFCLFIGRGSIFNRLGAAVGMAVGWIILFIPLFLVGSLLGGIAENDKVGQPDPPATVVEQP